VDFQESDGPINNPVQNENAELGEAGEGAKVELTVPKNGAGIERIEVLSLELDNFKSFDRKTTIPFRDGFTTISGPNGSGKSNVIDSLLFVLGLSSSKGMRAERLTDLLNVNTKKKYARVALKLRVHRKSGESQELEIARKVRKTHSNYIARYEIDGVVKKARELQEFLLELGLSQSGMNVVLQGDVMRLTGMSPLNRRRVLDETAGIAEFDKRITAAREELAQASRHMEDIHLILTELDTRLAALKDERETALKYRDLAEMKQSLEDEVVLLVAQKARDRAIMIARQYDDLKIRRDKLIKSYEESLKVLAESQESLDAAEHAYKVKGEGERLSAFKKREGLHGQLSSVEEKLKAAKLAIENSLRVEKEKGEELSETSKKSEKLGGKETELQDKLGELGEKHEKLDQEIRKAMSEIRRHNSAQADTIQELNKLQVVLRSVRNRDGELESRESTLVERNGNLTTETKLLTDTVVECQKRRDLVSRNEAESGTARRSAREKLAHEEDRQRRLIAQIHRLRDSRDKNVEELSIAESNLARYSEQVRQAQIYTNNAAVNTIMNSGLEGVHGTVRELCGFDPEYAAAIEAAAGGRLGWVIVDDERVAKKAIELLKSRRAGRLTFAPLTKIRPPQVNLHNKPRDHGVIDFALDLVDFEPMYEKVYRYVFGDTLVIEDLNTGLPLMGRHRMVTIDGDLLEKRGLMTGGRKKNSQAQAMAAMAQAEQKARELKKTIEGLNSKRSKVKKEERLAEEEARRIEKELSGYKSRVAETGASQLRFQEELASIDNTLQPSKTRLTECSKQFEAVKKELGEVTKERAELSKNFAKDDGRLRELTEANAGTEFERLSKITAEKEVELRALEETMSAVRDRFQNILIERRGIKEKQDHLALTIEESQGERSDYEGSLKGLESEKESHSKQLAELDQKLGKIAKELEDLDEKRKGALCEAQRAEQGSNQVKRDLEAARLGIEGAEEKVTLSRQVSEEKLQDLAAKGLGPVPDYPEEGYEEGDDPIALSEEVTKGLKKTINKMKSLEPVNMLAIDQYNELSGRKEELSERFSALKGEKEGLIERMLLLEEAKRSTFLAAFESVRAAFHGSFRELAHGEGELRLENEEDPFDGGLIIEARPRGKAFARLEAMSGGEKSLTALAFIFALQSVNPAPFYVFDEVDQSLDGANTELLAVAIQKRSRDRQYLVVSHHQAMLNESDQLLGVSARKGAGTVVTGISLKKGEKQKALA
jgi:chromosome segregation protein